MSQFKFKGDPTILELENLCFSWPNQAKALFGPISVRFETCTITTLLGPNGTGKTTLLNVMADRLSPSSGTIRIGGQQPSINDFNYMPQNSERLLFPHLTLRENIELSKNSKATGLSQESVVRQLFPNNEVLDKYPGHCSGGQRQRTVLCRAISDIPNFPVTLLDEPFAQISQDVRPAIYGLFQTIVRASGAVVVLVTHDIPEALIIGDQVMTLSKGAPMVFNASSVNDAESYLLASRLRDDIRRAAFFQN